VTYWASFAAAWGKPELRREALARSAKYIFFIDVLIPVPAFRSSCYTSAPTFTNFGKSRALANISILVPLLFEVPGSNSPLVARELQIGGASFVVAAPERRLCTAPAKSETASVW
jgi:hypothetical protein